MRSTIIAVLFAVFLTFPAADAAAQGVPAPLTIRLQPVLSGLSLPLYVTNARDGSNRIYILQQRGIIKVLQPGASTPTDFLNVTGVVSTSGNERGLLGLAFHPQYPTNGRFFIYYTRNSDGALEIAEFQRSLSDPNQANPTPVRTIITIPHSSFSNHNGGTILFGPDGYLYLGTGDGGSGNDPNNNAQNINSLLGKILRIDINTPVQQTPAYNIPPTNPYAGATLGADEIYALGMRNPYRFSFDRSGTNQLWVGDVGQDAIEEVDIIALGGNYGWRVYEGDRCTNNDPSLCIPINYLPPVFEYSSSGSTNPRCSVTGGHVYRGIRNSLPNGSYMYGDYCSGEILLWNSNQQSVLLDTARFISSFGEDESGELYVTDLSGGTMAKVVRAKARADFDGDLKTDVSIYRPSEGNWYLSHSSNNTYRVQHFGLSEDIPVSEDYDADNISDIGVYRPSTGVFYNFRSSDNTAAIYSSSGQPADIPIAADLDGDSKADYATFRPSNGNWTILYSRTPVSPIVINFGLNGDIPTVGDYDGDGKADISIFRPSTGDWWWMASSSPAGSGFRVLHWGQNGDIPVQGDFDGDFKIDPAVFRPSTGVWYVFRSTNGSAGIVQWGLSTDKPAVGDYDGDGLEDIAVFRPSTGIWYILRSANAAALYGYWGMTGDLPIPGYEVP